MTHVCQRTELKYLLDERQYEQFMSAVGDRLTPDAYFRSSVRNLYYDTPQNLLISRSLEKPCYKEKIRIRSYGTIDGDDAPVFLELKKKYKSVVYKRRIRLPFSVAHKVLTREYCSPSEVELALNQNFGLSLTAQNRQVLAELCCAAKLYKNLSARMALSYDRLAYRANDDPALRLTFDGNIRFDTACQTLTIEPSGAALPVYRLLEIKVVGGALPLWLSQTLSELKIFKTSFSKYGEAYKIANLRQPLSTATVVE